MRGYGDAEVTCDGVRQGADGGLGAGEGEGEGQDNGSAPEVQEPVDRGDGDDASASYTEEDSDESDNSETRRRREAFADGRGRMRRSGSMALGSTADAEHAAAETDTLEDVSLVGFTRDELNTTCVALVPPALRVLFLTGPRNPRTPSRSYAVDSTGKPVIFERPHYISSIGIHLFFHPK